MAVYMPAVLSRLTGCALAATEVGGPNFLGFDVKDRGHFFGPPLPSPQRPPGKAHLGACVRIRTINHGWVHV